MTTKVMSGKVCFTSLTKHDEYRNQSTGRYSLTITISPEDAAALEADGVKVKEYEDTFQRKFTSKFPVEVKVKDDMGDLVDYTRGEPPRGAEVKVMFTLGPEGGEHGTPTYLDKVRVMEDTDSDAEAEFADD